MVRADDAISGVDLGIPGLGRGVFVGRGGFAVVYRAVQVSSGGVVAVKILSGHLDEIAESRFQRETAALGALRGHPNICTVYDAGVNREGRPYLVMEYAPNGNLAQRLRADGPMEWRDAVAVAVKLAGALETAHRAGLLHRDIKPENVLITAYGDLRLADFGLARFTDDSVSRGGLTATLAHVAPELLRDATPSVASDVYALGSTLFQLLTGHAAFAASKEAHPVSVYRRIEEDPVPDLGPDVPDDAADVVRTAMAKDPAQRHASAEQMGVALQDVQRTHGVAVTPLPLPAVADRADVGNEAGSEATRTIRRAGRAPVRTTDLDPDDHEGDDDSAGGSGGRRRRTVIAASLAVLAAAVIATLAFAAGRSPDGVATTASNKPAAPPPSASSEQTQSGVNGCSYVKTEAPAARDVGMPTYDETAQPFTATLQTNLGDLVISMDTENAPCTTTSFKHLANEGYFTKTSCHRLTTEGIFVLQCGDPTGTGSGGPGYRFGTENAPADGSYPAGTVAMARGADPASNGSQFFLVYQDSKISGEGAYSIFGRVTDGLEIVEKLAARLNRGGNRFHFESLPADVVRIEDVRITPR